jgi:hypothetical protein
LKLPELSSRELAVRFTDEPKYVVSEASVYRLSVTRDLITGPAYAVIKAANEFKDKTDSVSDAPRFLSSLTNPPLYQAAYSDASRIP